MQSAALSGAKTRGRLLGAAIALSAMLAGQGHAADLMIEFRNGKWLPIPADEIDRRTGLPEAPQARPAPRREIPKALDLPSPPKHRPVASPPPASPPMEVQRIVQPVYKPADTPKTVAATSQSAPATIATESRFNAAISFLWRIIQTAFWTLVVFVVLANTRRILHFIDSVFEAAPDEQPTGRSTHDLQTESVAAAMTLDLRDLVQAEFSTADVRKQTEALRALKDQLDADLKAARATIRRERAKAQQQQT